MLKELEEFVKHLNTTHGDGNLKYEYTEGKAYYKVLYISGQTSVYAFVPKADINNRSIGTAPKGSLLFPAGWRKPARHPRGSIFDKETWKNASRYSLAYLK